MLAAYAEWHKALTKLPATDPATKITRDKWLLPLFYELGWGRIEIVSGGLDIKGELGDTTTAHFPISHRWSYPDAASPTAWVPIHLLGARVALDAKTAGVTARAPQSMVQDYLNRQDRTLWAILSNGSQLRLLRDASALSRQSYVEFDLDEIFANQLYADFRLLFLTAHATRFTPRLTGAAAKQAGTAAAQGDDEEDVDTEAELPEARLDNCWLERWRLQAIDVGSRARLNLQNGIAVAMEQLGNGFLACPDNAHLRDALASAPDADLDLHRALLRIAYRLILLFVAEDRELLHTDAAKPAARQRYSTYFSTARLRQLATTHAGGRHTDLWDAHQIITDALAGHGLPALGLNGLGAGLYARDFLGILDGARLPNYAFVAAIKALSQISDPQTGTPRNVDYRNLDSEEFGGMYEGLLAYTPRYDPTDHTFSLTVAAGNERKKSGSYYTPTELIDVVLTETLDPLIADARKQSDPEQALLALTVVDPACGSGHFVVGAARRIATALAEVRTGDTEPSPAAVRAATADVIERCLYGVDINDLAIEITKVALLLEAFDASRPLPFLDAHFRVGNTLLGTTPALLKNNIPDTAFVALGDDDKAWTTKLKARNKAECEADTDQLSFEFGSETLNVDTGQFHKAAQEADTGTIADLAQLRARADAWRKLEHDRDLKAAKLTADAWCAAFVQLKTGAHSSGHGITHATLRALSEGQTVPSSITKQIGRLARQYRFFHWHLEFPTIFTVGDGGQVDPATGWSGGFSCVIGNPPWETLQMEDKQFFSNLGRNDIADAPNAAARKKMIEKLATTDLPLYQRYRDAARESEATTHFVRGGRYPLTATGKINTYSLFAETMRTVVGPHGAAGILTPTGLATDKTTSAFFSDTLSAKRLYAFYDFENEDKIFRDVDHRVRFAVTVMTGSRHTIKKTRFAFLTRHIADLASRRFALAPNEVLRMNPNTGTLPMFRSRVDADITLGIYNRHPVLIRDDDPDGNAWGLSFSQGLFNMASDSHLFHQADDLSRAHFNGWSYEHGRKEYVPLYEAKMLSHFDHRFSTYRGATQAQLNVGSLPRPSDKEHDDPDMEVLARYWIDRSEVSARLAGRWDRDWLLGWRDIARSSDSRTLLPSVLPASAVGHVFPVAFLAEPASAPRLQAVWSTLVFDYVARQKLSGTHMTYNIIKQLAGPTPETFDDRALWHRQLSLGEWVTPYVLELSYTSWRLKPYAKDLGHDGPPFHWDPDRRALIRADLDAGFLHVYGLDRDESEHVLDSFPVVRKNEERDLGEFRTKRLVLEAYDRMAAAIAKGGKGWKPLADIPAGSGPRHRK
ncbi:Eco57I restriction-modification methylase domain-containing protein [Mycobacterium conspicuum]|nr:DNA methyltransferase [Mycobacterium conspicuum]